MNGSDNPSSKSALRWALGIGAVLAAVFVLVFVREKSIDETGRGRLVTAHQITLGDGRPVLILV